MTDTQSVRDAVTGGADHFVAELIEWLRIPSISGDPANADDVRRFAYTPTTCTGMRGMTDGQVDFRGPSGDIHSGSFGGAIRNPLTEMSRILGALHDEDGRVTIDGFYDGIVELTDTERALFAKLPYDENTWLANAKSTTSHGEKGFTTLERVWARPTAEINGLWGGYIGAGHWRVPQTARSSCSMAAAFGTEVLYTREGGSGPEADLQDVLEAPVVFLGVSLPDDGWPAPNEKVEIPLLLKGAEAAAHLWDELATILRA